MLDRMEQLEKRVAELEAKSNPAEAKAAETAAAQPTPAQPSSANAQGAAPVAATVASPAVAAAVTKSQEQASVAPPQKGRALRFADFTWLNGNARTKELAWTRNFSRRKSEPTSTTSTISTIPKTILLAVERSFQGQ